jgi:hypothetical protein
VGKSFNPSNGNSVLQCVSVLCVCVCVSHTFPFFIRPSACSYNTVNGEGSGQVQMEGMLLSIASADVLFQ